MSGVSIEHVILIFSALLFFSIFVGKAGYRFGVPILLLFMGVGMLAGSEGFGIQYDNIFTAQSVGVIALCIILFSGGLDTQYSDIKPVMKQGIVLATFGVFLTALFTGLFIYGLLYYFFPSIQLTIWEALLLASVMSSTDSASVFAILRAKSLSLKHKLRPLLELESGSNDPMAYMLTIVLLQIITGETTGAGDVILTFLMQMFFGVASGLLLGRLFVKLINKIDIQYDALYPILLLACALFTFSFTDFIQGNGYLAVYLCGLVMGNSKFIHKRTSKNFFDGLAWLMQLVMFLSLGLLVNPSELLPVAGIGLITAFFLILISRPLSVVLCMLPFWKQRSNKDIAFISLIGLRGAVPIVFAMYPLVYGIPHANFMFNIVFFITIVSLLVQGTLLTRIANWLKLTKPTKDTGLSHFDFAFSDDVKSVMTEINVSECCLRNGNRIMDLPLPENSLIVMIKRGDKYILPKGAIELELEDKLLIITDNEKTLNETYDLLGFNAFCEGDNLITEDEKDTNP